ncbi:response regulator [Pelagicoccus mobilis]|uniref:Response regulator n=1 Tax=Pelagicoccus mobilis TaxID=415221 RepID=A0A934S038_9BACT|nr:response regulator [Pelagicoccus mobilis]MBK1878086.1 response regulator [Pelagicoccus mobilis]
MSSSRSKHRILVVEDDRTSRKLLSRILEQDGYDVIECEEGRDALHFAEMNAPRAMVIDIMLPDMKGHKILEELESNKDCRFTKYIFLTGILSKKDRSKKYFFQLNGKRYRALPKPVSKSKLLKQLANCVNASIEEEHAERRANSERSSLPPLKSLREQIEETSEEEEEVVLAL